MDTATANKQTDTPQKIAVIGAGFTGLTTALRLAQAGHDVTLMERAENLGGLASGFTLDSGQPLERAYHFTYKTDTENQKLAKELGVADKLKFHPSSIGTFYDGKVYPLMTPIDLLKFPGLTFIQKIRTGVVALYLQRVRNWQKLTKITAMDWLTKYNGEAATKVIWEPLLKGKFSEEHYRDVTMAWLWGRIHVRQVSKDKGEVVEKLGYFDGSWSVLVDGYEKKLRELGVTIKTSTTLEEINYDAKGQKPYVVVKGKKHSFDRIVTTTPSNVLARLTANCSQMTKKYADNLNSIPYLDAVLMVFTSKQKLSDYYWHQFSDKNAPFLVLLDLTNLTQDADETYDGNHVYYIGAYPAKGEELFKQSDKQITADWYDGVRKMFPEFDESQVQEAHVFKYIDAQHIVTIGYEELIPDYQTPIPGVYLSNFTQIFPEDRGINFAIREGEKVANIVLDDIK